MQGSRGVAAMAMAGRRNAHYRAYPPPSRQDRFSARRSLAHAILLGLCWKDTAKAPWKLLYGAFINLPVFAISDRAAEPQAGAVAQSGVRLMAP